MPMQQQQPRPPQASPNMNSVGPPPPYLGNQDQARMALQSKYRLGTPKEGTYRMGNPNVRPQQQQSQTSQQQQQPQQQQQSQNLPNQGIAPQQQHQVGIQNYNVFSYNLKITYDLVLQQMGMGIQPGMGMMTQQQQQVMMQQQQQQQMMQLPPHLQQQMAMANRPGYRGPNPGMMPNRPPPPEYGHQASMGGPHQVRLDKLCDAINEISQYTKS